MNRVRRTMWQVMALLCLLILVSGCGKKMVQGKAGSDPHSRSGDRVKTYGQMDSLSTIMKDGLEDEEKIQLGESVINPAFRESDSETGKGSNIAQGLGRALESSSSATHGLNRPLQDDSADFVSVNLDSKDPGEGNRLSVLDNSSGNQPPANHSSQKGVTFSHNLRDVHFDFDSWRLGEQARDILEANAEWLKAHPHEHITIEGHCDERGTQSYNYVLGEKRATMVQQYLSFLGVPLDQLQVASFGKDRPACRTMTMDCFEQNRRAHFKESMNFVSQQPDAITR